MQQTRPNLEATAGNIPHLQPQTVRPTQSITPQPQPYGAASASPAAQYSRQPTFPQMTTVASYQSPTPQTPVVPQPVPFVAQQQLHPPAAYSATPNQGYGATLQGYARPPVQQPTQVHPSYQTSNVHEHRAPEAYVLSDTANASIPQDIRDQFPQDDQGRVLFFTKPPIDTRHVVSGRAAGDKGKPLTHTEKYLEAKEDRLKALAERKRAAQEMNGEAASVNGHKRVRPGQFGEERDADGRITVNTLDWAEAGRNQSEKQQQESERALQLQLKAVKMLQAGMMKATVDDYLLKYGDQALQRFDEDHLRATSSFEDEQQREMLLPDAVRKENSAADTRRILSQDFWTGRLRDGTGRFEDDFDNRLPR
jgi:hypothetical protein